MFWDRFKLLCHEIGKAPNRVGESIGVSSATITKWKNGSIPNGELLAKVADYFDVSMDYLMGRSYVRKGLSDDDFRFALFRGSEGITDEMFEAVLEYAEFVKHKYAKKDE
ncbi:MAG: helix-turn-helix transcriptional regulator [Clostridiales bacterium]|jgi:transcriptional regulator with XRE-family HTH domain|nr:helix-turn-helix transcriptional regulator [Clostridiales bacterium]